MNSKTTISITEARKKIFDIAKQVQNPAVHYTLTERGRPKAVIMSAEEFESWQETMQVMQEFPDLEKDIKEVENDFKTGAYKKYTTLDEILKKERLFVSDKKQQKYGLQNQNQTKGRKSTKKNP